MPITSQRDESAHDYERVISPDASDSFSRILPWIPPGSTVLDVGSGPGILGAYLKSQHQCVVDGIESEQSFADRCVGSYRNIFVENLEISGWIEGVRQNKYERIVCADVLEHLRNPKAVLSQLAELLSENGTIIISCPNVAYIGLIAELLSGDFRYRRSGLLDETHLRFFTLKSLVKLVHECGLRIARFDRVCFSLDATEFGADCLEHLPHAVAQELSLRPDAFTYQFLLEATADKTIQEPDWLAGAIDQSVPPARFTIQMFWAPNSSAFSEENSVRKMLPIGSSVWTIDFPLPDKLTAGSKLRLDPSDRAGQVTIYAVNLLDRTGQVIWSASLTELGLCESASIKFCDSQNYPELLLLNDDPWIQLSPPADKLLIASNLRVTMSGLTWRELSNVEKGFGELLRSAREEVVSLQKEIQNLQKTVNANQNKLAALEAEHSNLQLEHSKMQVEYSKATHDLKETNSKLLHLSDNLATKTAEFNNLERSLSTALKAKEGQLAEANELNCRLHSSLSWRLTKPLRIIRTLLMHG